MGHCISLSDNTEYKFNRNDTWRKCIYICTNPLIKNKSVENVYSIISLISIGYKVQ